MEQNTALSTDALIDVLQVGKTNYAVIVPNKIIFAVDASQDDVKALVQEERNKPENEQASGAQTCLDTVQEASMTLLPTFDCNLRCIYCYARGGDDQVFMPKQVAKSAIDAIRDMSNAQHLSLYFGGGGEPFVNFQVMDFAVRYAKQLFGEVTVAIVTNGTFGAEQLEWIVQNEVSVRISCDGVAHDYQRPFSDEKPSRDVVEANIRNLVSLDREFMIQCIVTSDSVHSMVESVDYFVNLGVQTLKIEPAHMSETCRGNKDMTHSPQEFARNFIETLKHIVANGLPLKIDTSYLSRPTTGYYCGVYGENLTVTPNGDVTACVEITRRSEPFSDVMLYGQLLVDQAKFVFNDTARAKLRMLHFANYSTCKKCSLRLICKGGCPIKNIWDSGFSLERSKYTCQLEKLIVLQVFSLMIHDARYSEVVFDDFQMRLC